ncbi:unnamed protein product [Moneuplotes crassus]|uniref:Uncharacterized protein n=1 Tax=Euplotes crassus TaxID=5936 RepID=A0AAD1XTC4_EUPCR|nr:unnamed protein product [Moneuplotes crassus]
MKKREARRFSKRTSIFGIQDQTSKSIPRPKLNHTATKQIVSPKQRYEKPVKLLRFSYTKTPKKFDSSFSDDSPHESKLIKELENYNILPDKKLQDKLDYFFNPYNKKIFLNKCYYPEEPKKWESIANLILGNNPKLMRQTLKNINQGFYKELLDVKEWAAKNRANYKWNKVINQTVDIRTSKDSSRRTSGLSKTSGPKSSLLKLTNAVKSMIRNKKELKIIKEEVTSVSSGEDSPGTSTLLKLLRRKKKVEAEKLEAKEDYTYARDFKNLSMIYKNIQSSDPKSKKPPSTTSLQFVKSDPSLIPNFSLVKGPVNEEAEELDSGIVGTVQEQLGGIRSSKTPLTVAKPTKKKSEGFTDPSAFKNYFKVSTERIKRNISSTNFLKAQTPKSPKEDAKQESRIPRRRKMTYKQKSVEKDLQEGIQEQEVELKSRFSIKSSEKLMLEKVMTDLENKRMNIQPISKSFRIKNSFAESENLLEHSKTSSMAIKVEVLEPIKDENDIALPKVTGDRRIKDYLNHDIHGDYTSSDLSKIADVDEDSSKMSIKLPRFKKKSFALLKKMDMRSRMFRPILSQKSSCEKSTSESLILQNGPISKPRDAFSPNPKPHSKPKTPKNANPRTPYSRSHFHQPSSLPRPLSPNNVQKPF